MGGGASKGNQTPRRLSLTKPPPQQHPQYPQHPQFPQHPQYPQHPQHPPLKQHPAKQRPGYDSQSPSPPMKRSDLKKSKKKWQIKDNLFQAYSTFSIDPHVKKQPGLRP